MADDVVDEARVGLEQPQRVRQVDPDERVGHLEFLEQPAGPGGSGPGGEIQLHGRTPRGARQLGVTRQTASERLRKLEAQLGVGGVASRIEPVLTVNDLEVACEAAIAGVGIARVPDILCRDALLDGRLERVFGPRPAMLRAFHAVYPSRSSLPAKVRLFVDALTAQVQPTPPLHTGRGMGARTRAKRG